MAQREPLLAVDWTTPLFYSGIHPSGPIMQAPLWRDGENVKFTERSVQKINGEEDLIFATGGDQLASGGYIDFIRYGGNIFANPNSLLLAYRQANSLHSFYRESGNSLTLLASDVIVNGSPYIIPWNDWGIFCLPLTGCKISKSSTGTGSWIDLSTGVGTGNDAPLFGIVDRGHLLLFYDRFNDLRKVRWSTENDPQVLEPTATNSAGDLMLYELGNRMTDVARVAGNVVVYSENSALILQYVGAPFYFGKRPVVVSGIGVLRTGCVVEVGPFNYGLSRKGLWRFDGINYEYVDDTPVRDWMEDNSILGRSSNNAGLTNLVYNDLDEEIIISHVNFGSPANFFLLTYNLRTGAWSKTEKGPLVPPALAFAPRGARNAVIVGRRRGISLFGQGFDRKLPEGTEPITAWVQTRPLDFGAPNLYKHVEYLETDFYATGATEPLKLRVGIIDGDDPNATPEWLATEALSRRNYVGRSGQFFVFKFTSTGLGVDWKISGMKAWGTVEGEDTR